MARKTPPRALIQIAQPGGQVAIIAPAVEAGKAFLAKNTIRAYSRDWMDFFGVDSLEKVSTAMVANTSSDAVADFRDRLLEQGLGPGTVNRKLSSVRAFFDQMILRGLLTINPAHPKLVRSPKRGTVKKMEALSHTETRAFLDAIDRTTVLGRRDFALIMVDLHMGLRRSEALGIRAEQFKEMDGKMCVVFRSKGQKERIIWINNDLQDALAPYSKDRGKEPGWLFPGRKPNRPLSGIQFWKIVQKYLAAAGIKKKIGTHGLRATFIHQNLQKGTPLPDIQRTVGHARGETTLGYARDMEMVKSKAPEAMEGFGADPKKDPS